MKKTQQPRILQKQLLQIPLGTVKVYDDAASQLRKIYRRPPRAQQLMLHTIAKRDIEKIISDFRHWNDVDHQCQLLTPLQRRIQHSFEKIQASRNRRNQPRRVRGELSR